MSKIFSTDPVFIQNLEEFEEIKSQFKNKQKIAFNCIICEKESMRNLKLLNKDHKLICPKCLSKQTCLEKYGVENPRQSKKVKEKYRQTCLKKYGVENPSQNQNIKEKKKQTSLEHYGATHPHQTKIVQDKIQKTCLKKYGVKHSSQASEVKKKQHITVKNKSEKEKQNIQKKRKQTCFERYGTSHPFQLKKFQDKYKQTCLEKYGVENPFQSKEIQEKIKRTCVEKYGFENCSQSQKVKEKSKQTMLLKYGTQHFNYKYIYDKEQFDSSWELAVWIWAKNVGKEIKREPICFEYSFKNQKHTYYPDFEIDGKLVEVKGSQFFKEDGTMQNPFDHSQDGQFEAKHQCGLSFNVQFWKEKEMKPILNYVEEKCGKGWKTQFKKK